MLFGEAFCQKRVANGSRERYVDVSKGVNVTDFCFPESKFPSRETMWVNCNAWPGRNRFCQFFSTRIHELGVRRKDVSRRVEDSAAYPKAFLTVFILVVSQPVSPSGLIAQKEKIMSAIAGAKPQTIGRSTNSLTVAVFTRLPMAALTAILLMIALRYLINPVQAGAAAGIAFTSPGAITVARVGFAGFPLAFATVFLSSLFSRRYFLAGLRTELMLLAIVIGVRSLAMVTAHSTETAKLLLPEFVLAVLCTFAIRLEADRHRREQLPRSS